MAQMVASFGNGIAKHGEVCSVLIVSLMILGMKSKRDYLSNPQENGKMINEAKEFINKFTLMAGALKCRDLLGCDPDSEAGTLHITNNNLQEKVCKKVMVGAIDLIEAI